MKSIALELIRTDGGTQMRAELHKETFLEYRDVWKSSPESFPPLVLFYDGVVYWLADGFHRFYGAREAGLSTVPADVRDGTQRDAILYAVGANQSNGLRRTNMDKRRAVETLLNDVEWVAWSDVLVSEHAGVSQQFANLVRKQLTTVVGSQASEQADKPRKGKDGKLRKPPKPKQKKKPAVDAPVVEDNPEEAALLLALDVESEPVVDDKPWVDGWGIPITKTAEKAFKDVEKFDALLTVLRQAKKLYKELADSPGGKYLTVVSMNTRSGWQNAGIENAIRAVKDCTPTYTVCPYAFNEHHGHDAECSACHGLEWLPDINLDAMPQKLIDAAKETNGVA